MRYVGVGSGLARVTIRCARSVGVEEEISQGGVSYFPKGKEGVERLSKPWGVELSRPFGTWVLKFKRGKREIVVRLRVHEFEALRMLVNSHRIDEVQGLGVRKIGEGTIEVFRMRKVRR